MNRPLLTLLSTSALAITIGVADARTLMGSSEWTIRQIKADIPYCTADRDYDIGANLKLAKNKNGEATIALDFKRDAFDLARTYPITLESDGLARKYVLRPASRSIVIVRVGRDQELLNAMASTGILSIQIDQEDFDVNLGNYKLTQSDINECLGLKQQMPEVQVETKVVIPIDEIAYEPIVAESPMADASDNRSGADYSVPEVDATSLVPPVVRKPLRDGGTVSSAESTSNVPPVQYRAQKIADIEDEKNIRIAELIEENRRLTERLTVETEAAKVAAAMPVIKQDPALQVKLDESASEIESLKSEIQMLRRENKDIQNLKDDEIARLSDKIATLKAENTRLQQSVIDAAISSENLDSSTKAEMQKLSSKLAAAELENDELRNLLSKMESDLIESRTSINPDTQALLLGKDNQIDVLQKQNEKLKVDIAILKEQSTKVSDTDGILRRENDVLRKNIDDLQIQVMELEQKKRQENNKEREVPLYQSIAADNNLALEELDAMVASLEAERDEYRRLLHMERQKDQGRAGHLDGTGNEKLIEDVRRLQAEKIDLMRKLEFMQRGGEIKENIVDASAIEQIAELQDKLNRVQDRLIETEEEKRQLENKVSLVDIEAQRAQKELVLAKAERIKVEQAKRELAQEKVARLAETSTHEAYQKELEEKTIRAEQLASRAQNEMMSEVGDAVAENQKEQYKISRPIKDVQDLRARIANRPSSDEQESAGNGGEKLSEKVSLQELSGDEIRQLIKMSAIPLRSSIDRIDRVSGPDFAAFRWDTGTVFGTAEQGRLSDVRAFDKSVERYIDKTKTRCTGSFDETIGSVVTSAGMKVVTADIACVDAAGNGNAASVLFFYQHGMFYALAHETDMSNFTVAMDMRDRLLASLK